MITSPENQEKNPRQAKQSWLRRNYLSVVMFALVIGLTIALFLLKDEIVKLGNYGYLGAFLISVLTNASILLPMPSLLLIFPLGATFNPIYIGLAMGVGGAIGEMTAYLAGYSGRGLWHDNPNYQKAAAWLKKWGMLIIFVYTATPMPMDLMGLAAGNLRFPVWKFFLPAWVGKTIKYIALSLVGYWGWESFLNSGEFRMNLLVSSIAVVAVIVLIILALVLENWSWKRTRKK
ncbi:MAG: VTT domain-containing protein [Dehalococcoidales bacterium]|nr:VTT domain-containing protein [Dehalococcoidales bacterium]